MPVLPATTLPYAISSAAQAAIDPQLVDHAQELAWNSCERATSYAATGAAGSGALYLAQHFTGAGIGGELVRLEAALTRLLGELEVRFIMGVIPSHTEGFLDLLAAYNSLVVENCDARYKLINMSSFRKPLDCVTQPIRDNKFTVVRYEALEKRCKTTKKASDGILLERGFSSVPHVSLEYGYHPSGSAPWRCPVPHMPVRHFWLYDSKGHALSESALKHCVVSSQFVDGVPYLSALRKDTHKHIALHTHKKGRILFDGNMSYNILFDESTGLAYIRELVLRPNAAGGYSPVEPPRSAPPVWPPKGPMVRSIRAPEPTYFGPEEVEEPRYTTEQYRARPQLSHGLASSSTMLGHGQTQTAYPPHQSRAYTLAPAVGPSSQPYHAPQAQPQPQVVTQQPHAVAGMRHRGVYAADFGSYPNNINQGN